MRFRLATRPPLAPFKAWFDIPDDRSIINVQAVKAQICSRLSQLVDDEGASLSSAGIGLFIDDFELLDDSGLDVIKENDLVHITRKLRSSNARKRKFTADSYAANGVHSLPHSKACPSIHSHKKRRLSGGQHSKAAASGWESSSPDSSEDETTSSNDTDSTCSVESSSSTSSSSSNSESDASSSSSTDSSSSSTSDSYSTSSSTPSSAVESHPAISPTLVKTTVANVRNESTVQRAPPGKGKPETRNRNARRRIRRLHERQQKQLEQAIVNALPIESVNAIPLGSKCDTVHEAQLGTNMQSDGPAAVLHPPEQGSPLEVENMITSLRNKNKKKGFMKSMTGVTAHRMTFAADDSGPPPESVSTLQSAASTTLATPKAAAPRLITPSEKQARGLLPSNVFVTSVEVESNSWDSKRKKKQRTEYGLSGGDGFEADGALLENDDTTLNYGEPEIDWASVDRGYGKMAAIENVSLLDAGAIVGWKELSINPATFTPDFLVYLGRVKAIERDTSSIIIERILRPGLDKIAFGASARVAEEAGGGDSQGEAVEVETYTFEQALKAQWKKINI